MTDLHAWVGATYDRLADLLDGGPAEAWDAPSLCAGWQVRNVVAHVTMPARLTPERFGAEMAAAGGNFDVLSNNVAERDGQLPVAELLADLHAPALHAWEPPGGGAPGALNHAVIHSLDVTVALGVPAVAPPEAVLSVLDQLAEANGAVFGVDLTGVRLETDDAGWSWGTGQVVRAGAGQLVALVSGRRLPDGRALRQAQHSGDD